jgi:hypothetical protein
MAEFGNSAYLDGQGAGAVAKLDFMPFAGGNPGYQCNCCACLVPKGVQKRMYLHAHSNRLEFNMPLSPFCCIANETCVIDRTALMFFDRPPTRVGLCLGCIPATCCGPPVIFVTSPKAGPINLKPCFGQKILYAPCNVFGCKLCLCFGAPCYTMCAMPLVNNAQNGEAFLAQTKAAVDAYRTRMNIDAGEMAIFESVTDSILDTKSSNKVGVEGGAPPTAEMVAR